MSDRHPVERFGYFVAAGRIMLGAAVAWLVTVGYDVYTHDRDLWAESSFIVGVCAVILGIVLVLVGKAIGDRRSSD